MCLLHSYRNPAHERAVGELLRAHAPEIGCALSCEVVAEIREYDRTSTTLTNVYVQGLAERYLQRLETRLRRSASRAPCSSCSRTAACATSRPRAAFPCA